MKVLNILQKRQFRELMDRVRRKFLCLFTIKMLRKPPDKRLLTLSKKAKQRLTVFKLKSRLCKISFQKKPQKRKSKKP